MYIVRNLTIKTIILSDIRAEIGPKKVLDLEKIARRHDIDQSYDLQHALFQKQLQVVKKSTVIREEPITETEQVVEETVKREVFDEDRLREILRQVVKEEMPKQTVIQNDAATKQLNNKIDDLMSDLRRKISAIHPQVEEPSIDPEKLAQISQKPIEKISEGLEVSKNQKNQPRKFVLKQTKNVEDMARELDI